MDETHASDPSPTWLAAVERWDQGSRTDDLDEAQAAFEDAVNLFAQSTTEQPELADGYLGLIFLLRPPFDHPSLEMFAALSANADRIGECQHAYGLELAADYSPLLATPVPLIDADDAHRAYASELIAAGRFDDALEPLSLCDPEHPLSLALGALILAREGHDDEAGPLWECALDYEGDFAKDLLVIRASAAATDDIEQSERLTREAIDVLELGDDSAAFDTFAQRERIRILYRHLASVIEYRFREQDKSPELAYAAEIRTWIEENMAGERSPEQMREAFPLVLSANDLLGAGQRQEDVS